VSAAKLTVVAIAKCSAARWHLFFHLPTLGVPAMYQRMFFVALCPLLLIPAAGCNNQPSADAATDKNGKSTVLVVVTSDPKQDPQAVDMAVKMAGFALEEKRNVAMFFAVQGVHLPTKAFSDEFAFQTNDSLKGQLKKVVERGAEIHVCPVCMKPAGIEEGDLIQGAMVTTRPKLFKHIGPDTAVFTF